MKNFQNPAAWERTAHAIRTTSLFAQIKWETRESVHLFLPQITKLTPYGSPVTCNPVEHPPNPPVLA